MRFGTFASYEFIAEDIVWAKLKALSDGAAIATKRLGPGVATLLAPSSKTALGPVGRICFRGFLRPTN